MSEIRWYKGKYCVEIILKSKGNYRVQALEDIPLPYPTDFPTRYTILKGKEFTTVPRLLWRHLRK